MATVTQEREALIEWLTDAVARLPERHELGDIRDAIAVALASAPPAAPPEDAPVYPNSDKGLAQMCPGVPLPVLRGIQEAAFRAGREDALTAAQAPPASDPPGLREALEAVLASAHPHPEHNPAMIGAWARAREVLAACPLPASPQAETKGDE